MIPRPGLILEAWLIELREDPDKDFLIAGITNGFDIVNSEALVVPVEVKNHPSASPGSKCYELVKQQVLSEISEGNYVICDSQPDLISPLGAIPKPAGGVRLIHDCSRPAGNCLNDFAVLESSQTFQNIDDATSLVQQDYYMAKVDLKSAYRSVNISKDSQRFTGLQFSIGGRTIYMRDTKLPFGSRLAPGIFHRLTQAVKRMMARRGFTATVAYLDDFFICGRTVNECATALSTLITLLRQLGFRINWNKVVDPVQCITFLGIEIDTRSMTKRLPQDKLLSLKQELQAFTRRRRASKKQIQSLAGKLSWAARVVYGGRVFIRRIIDAICPLRAASHKRVITPDMRLDIQWWDEFMYSFNGSALILDDAPDTIVYTDACEQAGGGHCEDDWFYCNWSVDVPEIQDLHINLKELMAVVVAARHWCHLWTNKHVLVMSDNSTTVAGVNRGSSRSPVIMKYLRYMFWLSAVYNFRLTAMHIPGTDNVFADKISRLHEPYSRHYLSMLLAAEPLAWHMTFNAFVCILDRG